MPRESKRAMQCLDDLARSVWIPSRASDSSIGGNLAPRDSTDSCANFVAHRLAAIDFWHGAAVLNSVHVAGRLRVHGLRFNKTRGSTAVAWEAVRPTGFRRERGARATRSFRPQRDTNLKLSPRCHKLRTLSAAS